MLYYLTERLAPEIGILNVLTYITVRSGGALLTGFFICLIVGPKLIRFLRALEVGQYIKKEHVQDLHALHKTKAGTPTMGGLLFIVSAIASVAIWGRPSNRLLLIATAVLFLMGLVGFIDDFIKLRRKKNDGLSARTKMGGQILVGLFLGGAVMVQPVTTGATLFAQSEILDWNAVAAALSQGDGYLHVSDDLDASDRRAVLSALNALVSGDTPGMENRFAARKIMRENRVLLEDTLASAVVKSPPNLHTSVAVPGFKNLLLPMGPAYLLFVVLIIVATSNAVNLTDGLDGLAIGASVISLFALTAIAYVVSRADWSAYLFVTHVPDASELTVFGAALLGSGLGFLWYNAYPAEVFMGDTGSLALGGVIGAMAVLTKQELLLPIVGGLFVIEALSVIIQVASFKMTGKRVFRMAPLHHHFELKGWSESKVTIRFWILAFMFALMSLATLKLR